MRDGLLTPEFVDQGRITEESLMDRILLAGQGTRIHVQMHGRMPPEKAAGSAAALAALLGRPAGYLDGRSEGGPGPAGEALPGGLARRLVAIESSYQALNAKGPTLVVVHGEGNQDARKALQAGSLHGHRYENLSFLSLGSPVSASAMEKAISGAGASFLGQINDWRDPVTYSKTATTITAASLLAGAGYGALKGCSTGAIAGGLVGCATLSATYLAVGTVPGILGWLSLTRYHPFERYIAKPEVQRLMFDWTRALPDQAGR
ncbi:MAG TPA: hypothetical protein PKC23_06060 [Candidatus Desulfobacillus sp.]|nr:hypothetical protein [Candidatus Desulfobacillus sp.]